MIADTCEMSGTQCAATENLSPNLKEGPTAIAFSAKDYGADAGEISPTLRAGNHDQSHANGGNWIGAPIPIQEIGKRTGVSTTNRMHGSGIGEESDPMFTLQSSAIHGVAHSLRAEGFDSIEDGAGRGTPIVPEVLAHGQGNAERVSDGEPSLTCNHEAPILFQTRIGRCDRGQPSEIAPALNGSDAGATSDMRPCVASQMAVRRITPRECERLQGFPDDYTLIQFRKKPAADGPRYKALGNSMAVPVMRWIGERIQQVEDL